MRRSGWLIFALVWTFALNLPAQQPMPPVRHLSADSVRQVIERTNPKHLLILDVRPREKFLQGHLPGAISIPLEELPERLPELRQQLGNDTLVVYCGNGKRSAKAVEILQKARLPVRQICNLKEGLQQWNGPLTKPDTTKVQQKGSRK